MTESKIEWTDRSDWNPIRGCTRVSPGCGGPGPHGGCYAEAMAARFSKPGMWGHGIAEMKDGKPRWTGKVELQEDRITLPLKWRKPAKIFVSSTSDVFHEALPDEAIDKIFAVMALCPQHTFQVLTKRAERMREYMCEPERKRIIAERSMDISDLLTREAGTWKARPSLDHFSACFAGSGPFRNVWLGISCERQQEADERIPLLLQTPAAVRFISAEPLLGAIDLTARPRQGHPGWQNWLAGETHIQPVHISPQRHNKIDWVIVGGESGPNARLFHIEWAESLVNQCKAAAVPCFVKQLGACAMSSGYPMHYADRKGGDWDEWPDDLRVREFPASVSEGSVSQPAKSSPDPDKREAT